MLAASSASAGETDAATRAISPRPADKRAALLERRNALRDALKATEAELNAMPENSTTQPAVPSREQEAVSAPAVRIPGSNPSTSADATIPPASTPDVESFTLHGQTTVITQWHDIFPAPYSGPLSLMRDESAKTSITGTLFTGMRLPWEGAAIYFDPEIAGGNGLSGVAGIASFPNGEIPRVGTPEPEPYVARAYYQQVFGLGGEKEKVAPDQNQLAGYRDTRRITIWLGKFAATDFFDNNSYSHDPRTQFMNWSLMDDTAWDYPADTRGYTLGGVVEYNEPAWAIRYGVFEEPKVANGGTLDGHVPQSLANVLEFEKRWTVGERAGVIRVMGFANMAHMGNYRRAIDNPGPNGPDVTVTRTYSTKYGFSLSAEQAITADLGIWGRAGWNDGHTESWAFTEVDRSASLGISLKGSKWGRPDDVLGFAGAVSGLSQDHRDYLANGGLGFIIGDGQLNYAPEEIVETYYLIKVTEHISVTPDMQFIDNPAYNSDRGPVFVAGVRVHAEF